MIGGDIFYFSLLH